MHQILGCIADCPNSEAQHMSEPSSTSSSATSVQILHIREQRVLLDWQLAELYGVPTKRLKEQVRRNLGRFPADFLFELSNQDLAASRSQIATLNKGRGYNLKYRPMAFTEHGAIMVASVLNSPRAVQMSVYVVRAFVRLRAMLESNAQLARRLDTLEKSVAVMDADTKRQFKELRAVVFALASPPTKEQ
jgi:hypothetical protein